MTSKPKPTRRKPAFRLPTVAAFAKLPLSKRTNLFATWLARQPKLKTYDYHDVNHCVLATFATALHRKPAQGAAYEIADIPTREIGKGRKLGFICVWGPETKRPLWDALRDHTTFGAASRTFQAALKG